MFDRQNGGRIIVKTARKERAGHNSRKRVASGARWSASPIVQRRVWFVVVGATRRTIYLGHTLPTATTSLRLSNANIVSEIVRRRDMSGRGNFATINPLVTLARERGLADNGERSVRFLRSISENSSKTHRNEHHESTRDFSRSKAGLLHALVHRSVSSDKRDSRREARSEAYILSRGENL